MDNFKARLYAAIWGAVAGGVMSLVVNWLFNVAMPRLRRSLLTRRISLAVEPPHHGHVRLRAINRGYWTVNNARVYLSLDIQEIDSMKPPYAAIGAHIYPGRFVPIKDDQLCWSVRSPELHPIEVSIYAKECQPFSPCKIDANFLTIPSEDGWKDANGAMRRAYLQRRRYLGMLKLVSADTDARYFSLSIDPESTSTPCVVNPIRSPKV